MYVSKALPPILKFQLSKLKGQLTNTDMISVFDSSKLFLGTLNAASYIGNVSLFNNVASRSSRPKKNSSITELLGFIK